MSQKKNKPERAPNGENKEFASFVVSGEEEKTTIKDAQMKTAGNNNSRSPRRRSLSVDEYVTGVLNDERTILSRAITLIESNSKRHRVVADEVLDKLLPHSGNAIRVGITGSPGVGKSTFIEALGTLLIEQGLKIAVLAVDPTSTLSKGSILGDKTRMETLSRDARCFIRPSPSAGTLGGVAEKSRETMLLCEAAGFDVLLIETVGVGQSEVDVRSMVDFFLLLQLPGAGDELQGIKRGIMELSDAIVVNKADGDNKQRAMDAKIEYQKAISFLTDASLGWKTCVHVCSALTREGIDTVWQDILEFCKLTKANGSFKDRRDNQKKEWFNKLIDEYLKHHFYADPKVKDLMPRLEQALLKNETTVSRAVLNILSAWKSSS